MPKKIFPINIKKPFTEQELVGHNRWHPDIPAVVSVNPGDVFRIECKDWTDGQIKNNDSPDDVRDVELSIVHVLSGPIEVKGAKPGDILVVDILDIGCLPGDEWGFTGIFARNNGGGFLTDHYPDAAKAIWDLNGIYRHLPAHPGRPFRRPDPSGPDRLRPVARPAGQVEQARSGTGGDQSRTASRRWPICPIPRTPSSGSLKGAAFDRVAKEAARTVPPREHGGNCDIKNLSRGSRIYFPVYVDGAKLSMGDIHFSQGDGEISFCGAIEMSGFIDLHVDIIKGGVAKYAMVNPIFKPGPVEPHHSEYLDLRGHLGRREGQAVLPRRPRRLQARLPELHRVPQEIRVHRRAGLPAAELLSVRGAGQRHRGHPQRLLHAGVADVDLREEHPPHLT